MIAGIDHFVITVRDLERSLAFYEDVFGCRRHVEPDRPAAILFGSQKINVHQCDHTFEPKARRPTEGAADFCLVSEWRIRDVQAHLAAKGVAVEVGPVERQGARGAMTSLYLRDPDGNLVEISEYGRVGAAR